MWMTDTHKSKAFVPHFLFWKATPHREPDAASVVVRVEVATAEVEALPVAAIILLGAPIAAAATNVAHARNADDPVAGSRQE